MTDSRDFYFKHLSDTLWEEKEEDCFAMADNEDIEYDFKNENNLSSLKLIKSDIEDAKKGKLRIRKTYLCDNCDRNINSKYEGFIIQGNIYTADPSVRGGLIGDNFPEPDENNKINTNSILETVLCKHCFCKSLGISYKEEKPWEKDYRNYKKSRNW